MKSQNRFFLIGQGFLTGAVTMLILASSPLAQQQPLEQKPHEPLERIDSSRVQPLYTTQRDAQAWLVEPDVAETPQRWVF